MSLTTEIVAPDVLRIYDKLIKGKSVTLQFSLTVDCDSAYTTNHLETVVNGYIKANPEANILGVFQYICDLVMLENDNY